MTQLIKEGRDYLGDNKGTSTTTTSSTNTCTSSTCTRAKCTQPAPEPASEPAPKPPTSKPVEETRPTSCPGRPHVCEYCGKDFAKVSSLHMHESQKHRDKIDLSILNTPVTFETCDRTFASQADLE